MNEIIGEWTTAKHVKEKTIYLIKNRENTFATSHISEKLKVFCFEKHKV